MRRSFRTASLTVGKCLGLNRFVGQTAWRRRRLLILCYHGISLQDEHEWNPALYMSPTMFARRMALLHRNRCTVLPLADAVERVSRGDLPERAVTLTFDDGYYDFLVHAWPVLKQYGYPATVYLTTLRCAHNFPIVNLVLSYMLWKRRAVVLNGAGVEGLTGEYPLHTAAHRAHVLALLAAHDQASKPPMSAKDQKARRIGQRLGVDYDALAAARLFTIMNPGEVADLSSQGVDFQLHTHRHRSPEDPELFAEEIRENRRCLLSMTGLSATHFCYPSGITRPAYLPLLARAGVVSATTTDPGIVAPASNPLLLPRFVDTSHTSEAEFEAWLHGLAPWLRQVA